MPDELVPSRKQRLKELESIMQNSPFDFNQFYDAALEVSREGLHNECGFSDFETYFKTKWPEAYKRYTRRDYQLLKHEETMGILETKFVHNESEQKPARLLPANEAQTRPLSSLPPEQRTDAWAAVIEEAEAQGVKPTAALVQTIVNALKAEPNPEVLPEQEPDQPEESKPDKPKKKTGSGQSGHEYIEDSFFTGPRAVRFKFKDKYTGRTDVYYLPKGVLTGDGWIAPEKSFEGEEDKLLDPDVAEAVLKERKRVENIKAKQQVDLFMQDD